MQLPATAVAPPPHAAHPGVPPSSPIAPATNAGAQVSPAYAKVAGAMARPSMWTGACMGALAGFMLAYQNSCGRLMGLKVSARGWLDRC